MRNIRFAGEVLANCILYCTRKQLAYQQHLSATITYIYGVEGAVLLNEEGAYGVVPERVQAWTDAFSTFPRVAPFLEASSPLLSHLEQGILAFYLLRFIYSLICLELKQFTTDTARETFPLDGDYKFYNPTVVTMTAYRAKVCPISFPLYGTNILFYSLTPLIYFLVLLFLFIYSQFSPL